MRRPARRHNLGKLEVPKAIRNFKLPANMTWFHVGIIGGGLVVLYYVMKGAQDVGMYAMDDVQATEEQAQRLVSAGHDDFYWPVDPSRPITSAYAWRCDPTKIPASGPGCTMQLHDGVDIGVPVGTPVQATGNGTVGSIVADDALSGSYVMLDHGNGWQSLYLHLSGFNVTKGQQVATGDVIGFSGGARGAWGAGASTGPHLHFMCKLDGKTQDPTQVVKKERLEYNIA